MSIDKKQLNKVLETKMDRKEFLRYTGILSLTMIGVSRFVDVVQKPLSKKKRGRGYGSSAYGD